MRVLFTGGGTAGHINPALAVAGYLREQEPDTKILYVGNRGGMEERLVPRAGYEMAFITISGFQRRLSFKNLMKNLRTVERIFTATAETKRIIKDFAPDVCVGTGGYVSGPVIREAAKLGVPSVIHESNAYPGVTTKLLSKQVHTVLLAVPDAKKYFDESVRTVITGNPVRGEVLRMDREQARKELGLDSRPLVLSFGGSLGAAMLNRAAAYMLAESAKSGKYQHIHGYGQNDPMFLEELSEYGLDLPKNPQIRVLDYIHNMPTCLAAADLVISRAGAMTLSEIEAKGKASILIPSPNVAENHQFHNAMALVKRGAGEIIEEKDLTGEALWKKVEKILSDPERLKSLGENAQKMDILDANNRIYKVIKEAYGSKGK
ncbi:undecaprenyldiphospho-muramoylpentapeptide beta-N-acetylglucosaminyltransferase [Acutalibacter muris]|jgi:UDP-N-acetylglucosamine--N-acetylmuramyl-(pentapeptide) pyrophosphoryl-undecaprenol N-acetylglucosamine transferase|uniref:UDP-N-acetylglucosamine--N-acetylmuramyl-(pentapeptide) pyrophosphoryl-undecaprenol N-acetylglucosamine transferase n=1 Tax=Acutalibacter muris TaxID=1796620 RepID=A0A1Z2XTA5_9FIRM|nr:undecaprenyldiphospho-muramoylpentapeptide beta-N-acetylglucosaminyltransferase [Acutalibacter muris]ANU55131.1 undecaprenyldiphospho-muramoylpentapeptide beta-N-acetylglucosaminyltransferase [Hungateiclostridiaceae bacterium KB18]ASB41635.1 undecaprenyldiphospho-muramoylpentapeptide beta-N-acetylglucosaminyltransferase [Acutalibacter muris]MCI9192161.1 undecaprenyldiphospho-muramoylpentapeptide beta-N-acetylglucosaminyltransferase [Acutalibacter muris]MCI9543427.1 undecaprenyldiphospho-mura